MTRQDMSFDERYRAILSRDPRFDGQFIMAVRTTGIYCRPSCPARTPKPENTTFFPTSAAAHAAGYRACRRCLPGAAPGSPEWDVRGDVVGRAMRLIRTGAVDREGVAGLARRLGYSSRQLNRVLQDALGAPAVALARAHRAHTARTLLVQTDLPAADVAFAAGFSSVRQFNETVQAVFGLTPTRLRAARRTAETHPASSEGAIHLALPHRPPLDHRHLFTWLRVRAVPGLEEAEDLAYARTLRLPRGPGWFRVWAEDPAPEARPRGTGPGEVRLRLAVRTREPADLPAAIAAARHLFDLDADLVAIDEHLARQPGLRETVHAHPGVRVPGTVDPGETLLRTMLGQQVSVAAARTALTRLVDALGEPAPEGGDRARLFPTAQAIAQRGHEVLTGPAARVRSVLDVARALAEGDLTPDTGDDPALLRERLLAQPGIGPWTADLVRTRVTKDPDVLLASDLGVRRGAAILGLPARAADLTRWAAPCAPWRSYLTTRLWQAAASETG